MKRMGKKFGGVKKFLGVANVLEGRWKTFLVWPNIFESCIIVDWKWGGRRVVSNFFGIGDKNDCGSVKTFWEMMKIFRVFHLSEETIDLQTDDNF